MQSAKSFDAQRVKGIWFEEMPVNPVQVTLDRLADQVVAKYVGTGDYKDMASGLSARLWDAIAYDPVTQYSRTTREVRELAKLAGVMLDGYNCPRACLEAWDKYVTKHDRLEAWYRYL